MKSPSPKPSIRAVIIRNGAIAGFVFLPILALLITIAFVGYIAVTVTIGLLVANDKSEITIQRVASPENSQMVASVIRDDCGATCGCSIRVDVEMPSTQYTEVWRSNNACAATIQWTSKTTFIISVDDHTFQTIDVEGLRKERR